MRLIDADKCIDALKDLSCAAECRHEYGASFAYLDCAGLLESAPTIQWHRCEDEMPSEDGECLCYNQELDFFEIGTLENMNGKYICTTDDWEGLSVTHWMPLPDAPKEE